MEGHMKGIAEIKADKNLEYDWNLATTGKCLLF